MGSYRDEAAALREIAGKPRLEPRTAVDLVVDPGAPVQRVVQIMDELKAAGGRSIALAPPR